MHIHPENSSRIKINEIEVSCQEEEKESILNDCCKREMKYVFDLEREPLIRLTKVKINNKQLFIILNMHHIIVDGWGINVLLRQVMGYIDNITKGIEKEEKDIDFQYRHYVRDQINLVKSDSCNSYFDLWKRNLNSNILPSRFPKIENEEDDPLGVENHVVSCVGGKILTNMKELSSERKLSINSLIIGAIINAYNEITGKNYMTTNMVFNGRSSYKLQNLIGFARNVILTYYAYDQEKSYIDNLEGIDKSYKFYYKNQDYPLLKLIKTIPELFDFTTSISINILIVDKKQRDIPNVTWYKPSLGSTVMRNDITLHVYLDYENGIRFMCAYDQSVYNASTAYKFVNSITTILKSNF